VQAADTPAFLAMVGMMNRHSDAFWRGRLIDGARHVLNTPHLHAKFATMNGESSIRVLRCSSSTTTRTPGTTFGVPSR